MPSPDDTRALALRLMDDLGRALLGEPLAARGWTFGFDRARRRLGACHIGPKRITLSASLSQVLPLAEVEDTVRHEVAHAIDAERRGRSAHDRTWKAIARACGARPERTFRGDLPDRAAPYRAVCPSCGAAFGLYRQPVRAHRCRACHRAGRPAYLRVSHVTSGRTVWPGGQRPGAFGGWVGVQARCPGCGEVYRRARRPSRPTACAACCSRHAAGRFDDRFRLRYERPGPADGEGRGSAG